MTTYDFIILAGGKGTRLQSVVADRPKALAAIDGVPFLQRQLDALAQWPQIRSVILSIGHQADALIDFCAQQQSRYAFPLRYVEETTPLGTGGGAALAATQASSDAVFVLNGDTYCAWPLDAMCALHTAHPEALAIVACRHQERIDRYGRIEIDDTQRVRAFVEKPAQPTAGWMNVGAYLIARPALLAAQPRGASSMETDLLPAWLGSGVYSVPCTSDTFIDIGTPESYAAAADIMA